AVTANPAEVTAADRVVLPGVGAFADCKKGLESVAGMREALEVSVRRKQRPFLGICVGCQLMAERGLEFGITPGFGWIAGDVKAIEPRDPTLKVPHMGWNTLQVANPHPLLDGIATGPDGWHAYFVHSYHLATPDHAALVAETDYGGPVTAMVGKDNLAGTQFHPEKSQTLGLRLIANFLKWHP
ncbi:MAG TPA: imidazole glycerol phosphate synthase subunit HisH, partial [Hyphomicrobiaceae bacterium]|nr:imidazole glycerol phosphate synthase subunit HisH [Hyphomicrobiaceae bacterium]